MTPAFMLEMFAGGAFVLAVGWASWAAHSLFIASCMRKLGYSGGVMSA
jgi:hypothetical protein